MLLTGTVWEVLEWWDPEVTGRTGIAGSLALFGQSLDAISTTIGIDVLGTTWAFVLLKLGLAAGIVVWTGRSADLEAFERRVLLGIVTVGGLIPAINNLVLQSLS